MRNNPDTMIQNLQIKKVPKKFADSLFLFRFVCHYLELNQSLMIFSLLIFLFFVDYFMSLFVIITI
jgi:hypothetical protein